MHVYITGGGRLVGQHKFYSWGTCTIQFNKHACAQSGCHCFVWPGNHSTLIRYVDPLSHRLGCNNSSSVHFGVWFRLGRAEETMNIQSFSAKDMVH